NGARAGRGGGAAVPRLVRAPFLFRGGGRGGFRGRRARLERGGAGVGDAAGRRARPAQAPPPEPLRAHRRYALELRLGSRVLPRGRGLAVAGGGRAAGTLRAGHCLAQRSPRGLAPAGSGGPSSATGTRT